MKKQPAEPCKSHPSYTGQRRPRTECAECWAYYTWNKECAKKEEEPAVQEAPPPPPPPPPVKKARLPRARKAATARTYKIEGEVFQKLAKNLQCFKITEAQLEKYLEKYNLLIAYLVERYGRIYTGIGDRQIVEFIIVTLNSLELFGEISFEDEEGTTTK